MINDYFDFRTGVDTRPEHGSGVLTRGEMTPPQALTFALVLLLGAALCALVLVRENFSVVLPLIAIGLSCAILYPAVLKKYGLGDVLIIVTFGIGLTLGAYAVQVRDVALGQWSFFAFYSAPVCLLVDAILHANNLRDAADDRAAHVRTLATMLSPAAGQSWQRILLFGPLVFVIGGVLARVLPLWSLATLLTVPLLGRAYRSGSVPGTAQTHLAFGLLYTASFLVKPMFL